MQIINEKLTSEQVRKILKHGQLTEDELEAQFNKKWEKLISGLPVIMRDTTDVAAEIESKLIDFVRSHSYESKLIGKLQDKTKSFSDWRQAFELEVKKEHFVKIPSSTWIAQGVSQVISIGRRVFNISDPHQLEAQKITHIVLSAAEEYLKSTTKKDTDFNTAFIQELLRLLDATISELSKEVASNFAFTPAFRCDVYLTVCGYATGKFKQMADSFRERHDPLVYLERNIKGPLFTRFKNQYYQTEAEEAIANTLRAHLKEPIREQAQKSMGRLMVEKLKSTKHFNSKNALKVKILTDLHEKDDFEAYMVYVTDVKQSIEDWIQEYTVKYCDEKPPNNEDTRLQRSSKEEVSRLIGVVENRVNDINETDVRKWLSAFCQDKELRREVGVKLTADDLLTDHEGIYELNLENFKQQIKVVLRELKRNLHDSLRSIKCKSEMIYWNDKPIDILKKIVGCTAQCPFCGEQCDLQDPNHDTKQSPHLASVHRPSCLAGCKDDTTRVLTTEFCPAEITEDFIFFRNKDTKYELHKYKQYNKIYPDWFINPDCTSEDSKYWKLFVSKNMKRIADRFNALPANVPSEWGNIKWADVEQTLKASYLNEPSPEFT